MELNKKWIITRDINDNQLYINFGEVIFHQDFLGSQKRDQRIRQTVQGGGWWVLDEDRLIFYSSSSDFGICTDDLMNNEETQIMIQNEMRRYKRLGFNEIHFTTTNSISLAIQEAKQNKTILIHKYNEI